MTLVLTACGHNKKEMKISPYRKKTKINVTQSPQ